MEWLQEQKRRDAGPAPRCEFGEVIPGCAANPIGEESRVLLWDNLLGRRCFGRNVLLFEAGKRFYFMVVPEEKKCTAHANFLFGDRVLSLAY